MINKSNTTQIWADGYSFMEVTETLMMALGIRTDDGQTAALEPQRVETAAASVRPLAGDASGDR